MTEADQIINPLDGDTSRGPDFWFSVRNIDKMRDLLRLDIRHLEKRVKGTVRSMRSASIRAHVKKRQERLTTGRMRAALASLLGKYKNVFLYDIPTDPGAGPTAMGVDSGLGVLLGQRGRYGGSLLSPS
jgi:hypothetical protein